MKDKFESKAEELKDKLTGDESEQLKGDAKQTGEDLASDAEEDSTAPEHSPGHVIPRSAA
jgi:hypothetical protein